MSDIAAKKKAEGNGFFAKKMYPQAIECYTEAIKHDPSNHILYSNRAMAYSAIGKWKEAKEDGLACIERDKTFLKGYHRAANAMINLGEFIEAEDTLNKGLTYNANDPNLLSLLKIAAPRAKDLREAAMSKMPPLERYKAEGNEYFKSSKFPEAINSYTKAIQSAGEGAPMNDLLCACYNNRAACYQQLGNYEAVVADASRVIEYDPKNVKALLRRGLAFESLERYRSALEDIRAVLAINPTIDMANRAQHRIGNAVRILKQNS
ncbi:stress-inducible protein [Blastocystis sp. subtype 4]|uniref:stress-inducible protein n=1 Tax=Blastocystis sp. subtype 4 TaxID=944170 RepID=UPI000711771D|nr:stress-inducible protein [Blastocystis sp. subtype 4]KNB42704.1 stress-inducible protein [Blastocystis sp. subtype 4]|eukprot:XP_014526147.1 stress-inducible protein [Blastocystis sp. subtype 4]